MAAEPRGLPPRAATRFSTRSFWLRGGTTRSRPEGDVLVILLGGGKKKGQQHDIATAHERWKDYRQRRPQEK